MKIVIINAFETYENRVNLIYDYLNKHGNNVSVVQSDFLHVKKEKRFDKHQHIKFINTQPYKKNISIQRLGSHWKFSKKAIEIVETIEPDIVYGLIPPNSLVEEISLYKKRNPRVKIIFDIIDLWPETFPIPFIKKNHFFSKWRKMRDSNLMYADQIITECDYFQEKLLLNDKKLEFETLYMSRKDKNVEADFVYSEEVINLCYLGSINNIIDIKKIKNIIEEIQKNKPVILHVIGDGEKKEKFIKTIESIGSKVIFHGKIYDSIQKQKIFDVCHFGLNIMKSTVIVGLTMKSVDYFEAGLPIINNIPGDTSIMVEEYNVGLNIIDDNTRVLLKKISNLTKEEYLQMRYNTSNLYKTKLSEEAFNAKLEKILSKFLYK